MSDNLPEVETNENNQENKEPLKSSTENDQEQEADAVNSDGRDSQPNFCQPISENEQSDKSPNEFRKMVTENALTMAIKSDDEITAIVGKRSMVNRMFGPMEAGSLRGSIFAISSLALGTGCLSLPIRFTQLGLAWGLFFLIVSSCIAYWSLTIMIKAAEGKKSYDYSRFVKESLGPIPAMILDCVIMLYIFGVLISYQVIIFSLIGRVYYDFANLKKSAEYPSFKEFETSVWNKPIFQFPIMYGVCIILIPLCLLKDISKMRFTSMFSICSLFYVISVVVIQSPFFYKDFVENKQETLGKPNWYDLTNAFGKTLLFFPCLATIFFSFTCHVGAFPVYKTLKNYAFRRIDKVFRRSIILDVVIYVFVGTCGFLTAPRNPPDLIIYRETIFENDIFMTIAKIAIAVNLICSTPANYNAFRISFFETILKRNDIPDKLNLIVTIPTILIVATIGALYNKIIAYIALLGGFCSVTISFLFPILLYVKNNGQPMTSVKNILLLIFGFILCGIGWTAGIETILFDMIGIGKEKIA